jgi:hypothetical protein
VNIVVNAALKGRKTDETLKRASPSQYLSPQHNRHEQTKQEIRLKILLENSRLKSNIITLRKDIDSHRGN